MAIQAQTLNTTNLLIPYGQTTHAVQTQFTASATPTQWSWGSYTLQQGSNVTFSPQAAYVDNTAGTAPLVVTISPIGYTFTVPAGVSSSVNYPAPLSGQGFSATGSGNASIVWVDYPIVGANVSVTQQGASDVVVTNSPTVLVPQNYNGAPYDSYIIPQQLTFASGSIAAGATSYTYTNSNATSFRVAYIDAEISPDATLAAAGVITLSYELNGTPFYITKQYVPAAASNGSIYTRVPIGPVGGPVLANGQNLSVNLSSALATGSVTVNLAGAYF